MDLPLDLRTALQTELDRVPSRDIAAAVRELSQRYRGQQNAGEPLTRAPLDAVAYSAYRLPATYAALRAVLGEVTNRRPDLQPATLLDVGAGPGTAAWAAIDVWPGIERITSLERDPQMVRIGQALATASGSAAIRDQVWRRIDITGPWECNPAEVTIAAYVLGELPSGERRALVQRLWDCTGDTCVIVEPGTPRGSGIVSEAGDRLADAGAQILAPFPHGWHCLASEGDWCHFSQRVPRTRLHRTVKEAARSYEDEKYAYVVAARVAGVPIAARVVRHPQVRSGHVRLVLCTAEGVKHVVVARSNRPAYRRARDLAWGSAIPVEDADLYGL